jgi:hypothetical protein
VRKRPIGILNEAGAPREEPLGRQTGARGSKQAAVARGVTCRVICRRLRRDLTGCSTRGLSVMAHALATRADASFWQVYGMNGTLASA